MALPSASRVMREPRARMNSCCSFFGRAINNVESVFQLFEKSRDFFGRMLQIVIDRHDHVVFRRADPAQQGVMLAIVAHQIQPADIRDNQ